MFELRIDSVFILYPQQWFVYAVRKNFLLSLSCVGRGLHLTNLGKFGQVYKTRPKHYKKCDAFTHGRPICQQKQLQNSKTTTTQQCMSPTNNFLLGIKCIISYHACKACYICMMYIEQILKLIFYIMIGCIWRPSWALMRHTHKLSWQICRDELMM